MAGHSIIHTGPVADFIVARHNAGASHSEITVDLATEFGLFIHRTTVLRWLAREACGEREAPDVKAWHEASIDNHRKRAALRRARGADGAFFEVVNPGVVYDRDGGVCGICDGWVFAGEEWHIDHIHPLSKGGAHSYANVQLAHAFCNLSKGTKFERRAAA